MSDVTSDTWRRSFLNLFERFAERARQAAIRLVRERQRPSGGRP